jgi:hypothetical protein
MEYFLGGGGDFPNSIYFAELLLVSSLGIHAEIYS